MTSHASESAVPHGRTAAPSHRRRADVAGDPEAPQDQLLDPAADTAMFRAFVDDESTDDRGSARGTVKALIGFVLLVLVLVVLYFTFLH